MKRIIAIVMAICVLCGGYTAAFAAEVAMEHNWVLLDTVDGDEVYYDQTNYSYNEGTGIMDVWAKQTINKPGFFLPRGSKGLFTHFILNLKTSQSARSEYNFIDGNGKVLRHGTVNPNEWKNMDKTMKRIVNMIVEKRKAAATN